MVPGLFAGEGGWAEGAQVAEATDEGGGGVTALVVKE